jgi:hypothetical protein
VTWWKAGIAGVKAALAHWKLAPPTVWHPEDAWSAALAHAAGKTLGLPVKVYPRNGTLEPGLVVLWDLERAEGDTLDALAWHRPGQVVWSHLSPWSREPAFCPDLVTLLHHSAEPPAGTPDAVSAAAAEGGPASLDPTVDALLAATGTLRTASGVGAFQTRGPRRRQRVDTPVFPAAR